MVSNIFKTIALIVWFLTDHALAGVNFLLTSSNRELAVIKIERLTNPGRAFGYNGVILGAQPNATLVKYFDEIFIYGDNYTQRYWASDLEVPKINEYNNSGNPIYRAIPPLPENIYGIAIVIYPRVTFRPTDNNSTSDHIRLPASTSDYNNKLTGDLYIYNQPNGNLTRGPRTYASSFLQSGTYGSVVRLINYEGTINFYLDDASVLSENIYAVPFDNNRNITETTGTNLIVNLLGAPIVISKIRGSAQSSNILNVGLANRPETAVDFQFYGIGADSNIIWENLDTINVNYTKEPKYFTVCNQIIGVDQSVNIASGTTTKIIDGGDISGYGRINNNGTIDIRGNGKIGNDVRNFGEGDIQAAAGMYLLINSGVVSSEGTGKIDCYSVDNNNIMNVSNTLNIGAFMRNFGTFNLGANGIIRTILPDVEVNQKGNGIYVFKDAILNSAGTIGLNAVAPSTTTYPSVIRVLDGGTVVINGGSFRKIKGFKSEFDFTNLNFSNILDFNINATNPIGSYNYNLNSTSSVQNIKNIKVSGNTILNLIGHSLELMANGFLTVSPNATINLNTIGLVASAIISKIYTTSGTNTINNYGNINLNNNSELNVSYLINQSGNINVHPGGTLTVPRLVQTGGTTNLLSDVNDQSGIVNITTDVTNYAGDMNISGGIANVTGNLNMYSGNLNVSGGLLQATGTSNNNGGTINFSGGNSIITNLNNKSGDINVTNGMAKIDTLTKSTGDLNITGGNFIGGTITNNGGDIIIAKGSGTTIAPKVNIETITTSNGEISLAANTGEINIRNLTQSGGVLNNRGGNLFSNAINKTGGGINVLNNGVINATTFTNSGGNLTLNQGTLNVSTVTKSGGDWNVINGAINIGNFSNNGGDLNLSGGSILGLEGMQSVLSNASGKNIYITASSAIGETYTTTEEYNPTTETYDIIYTPNSSGRYKLDDIQNAGLIDANGKDILVKNFNNNAPSAVLNLLQGTLQTDMLENKGNINIYNGKSILANSINNSSYLNIIQGSINGKPDYGDKYVLNTGTINVAQQGVFGQSVQFFRVNNQGTINLDGMFRTAQYSQNNSNATLNVNSTGIISVADKIYNISGNVNVNGYLTSSGLTNSVQLINYPNQQINVNANGKLGGSSAIGNVALAGSRNPLGDISNSGIININGGYMHVANFDNLDASAKLTIDQNATVKTKNINNYTGEIKIINGNLDSIDSANLTNFTNQSMQNVIVQANGSVGANTKLNKITNKGSINSAGTIVCNEFDNNLVAATALIDGKLDVQTANFTNNGTLTVNANGNIIGGATSVIKNSKDIITKGNIQLPIEFTDSGGSLTILGGSLRTVTTGNAKDILNINIGGDAASTTATATTGTTTGGTTTGTTTGGTTITNSSNNDGNVFDITTIAVGKNSVLNSFEQINIQGSSVVNLNAGKLKANGSLSLATNSSLNISDSAILDGSSAASSSTTSAGTTTGGTGGAGTTAAGTAGTGATSSSTSTTANNLGTGIINNSGTINVTDTANIFSMQLTNNKNIINANGNDQSNLYLGAYSNKAATAKLNISGSKVYVNKVNNTLGGIEITEGELSSDSTTKFADLINSSGQTVTVGSNGTLGGSNQRFNYIINRGQFNLLGKAYVNSMNNKSTGKMDLQGAISIYQSFINKGELNIKFPGMIDILNIPNNPSVPSDPSGSGATVTPKITNYGSIITNGNINLPIEFASANGVITIKGGSNQTITSSSTTENYGIVNFDLQQYQEMDIDGHNQITKINQLNLKNYSQIKLDAELNVNIQLTTDPNAQLMVSNNGKILGAAEISNLGGITINGNNRSEFGRVFNYGIINSTGQGEVKFKDFINNLTEAQLKDSNAAASAKIEFNVENQVLIGDVVNQNGTININQGTLSSVDIASPSKLTNAAKQVINIYEGGGIGTYDGINYRPFGDVTNYGVINATGGDVRIANLINNNATAKLNINKGSILIKDLSNDLGSIEIFGGNISSIDPANPSKIYNAKGQTISVLANGRLGKIDDNNSTNKIGEVTNNGSIILNGKDCAVGDFTNDGLDKSNQAKLEINTGNITIGNLSNVNGDVKVAGGDLSRDPENVNPVNIENYNSQTITISDNASIGKVTAFNNINNKGIVKAGGDYLGCSKFTNNAKNSKLNITNGKVVVKEILNTLGEISITGGDLSAELAVSSLGNATTGSGTTDSTTGATSGGTISGSTTASIFTNAANQKVNIIDGGKLGSNNPFDTINNYGYFNADGVSMQTKTINNYENATFLINNDANFAADFINQGNLQIKLDANIQANSSANANGDIKIQNYANLATNGMVNIPIEHTNNATSNNIVTSTINGGKFIRIIGRGNNNDNDILNINITDGKILYLNTLDNYNNIQNFKNLRILGNSQVYLQDNPLNLLGDLHILNNANLLAAGQGNLFGLKNLINAGNFQLQSPAELATLDQMLILNNYGSIDLSGNAYLKQLINHKDAKLNLNSDVTIGQKLDSTNAVIAISIDNQGEILVQPNAKIFVAPLVPDPAATPSVPGGAPAAPVTQDPRYLANNGGRIEVFGEIGLPIKYGETGGTIVFRSGKINQAVTNFSSNNSSGNDILEIDLVEPKPYYLNNAALANNPNNLTIPEIDVLNIKGSSNIILDNAANLKVNKALKIFENAKLELPNASVAGAARIVNLGEISLAQASNIGTATAIAGSVNNYNIMQQFGNVYITEFTNQPMATLQLHGNLNLNTSLINMGDLNIYGNAVVARNSNVPADVVTKLINAGNILHLGTINIPIEFSADGGSLTIQQSKDLSGNIQGGITKSITGVGGKDLLNFDIIEQTLSSDNAFKDLDTVNIQSVTAKKLNPPQNSELILNNSNSVNNILNIEANAKLSIGIDGDLSGGAKIHNQGELVILSAAGMRALPGTIGKNVPMGDLNNESTVVFNGGDIKFNGEISNQTAGASIEIKAGTVYGGNINNRLGKISVSGVDTNSKGDLSSFDPNNLSNLFNATNQTIEITGTGSIGKNLVLNKITNQGIFNIHGDLVDGQYNLNCYEFFNDNLGVITINNNINIDRRFVNAGLLIIQTNGTINEGLTNSAIFINSGKIINAGAIYPPIKLLSKDNNVRITGGVIAGEITANAAEESIDFDLNNSSGSGFNINSPIKDVNLINVLKNSKINVNNSINGMKKQFRIEQTAEVNLDSPSNAKGDLSGGGEINNHGTLTISNQATLGATQFLGKVSNFGMINANGGELKVGAILNERGGTLNLLKGPVTIGLDGSNELINKGTMQIQTSIITPISYTNVVNSNNLTISGEGRLMPTGSMRGRLGNIFNTGNFEINISDNNDNADQHMIIYGDLINSDVNITNSLNINTIFKLINGRIAVSGNVKNNFGTINIGEAFSAFAADLSSINPNTVGNLFNGNGQVINVVGLGSMGRFNNIGTINNLGQIKVVSTQPDRALCCGDFYNKARDAKLELLQGNSYIANVNNMGTINIGNPDDSSNTPDLSSIDPNNPSQILNDANHIINIQGGGTIGANRALGLVNNKGVINADGGDLKLGEILNNSAIASFNIFQGTIYTKKIQNKLGIINISGGDLSSISDSPSDLFNYSTINLSATGSMGQHNVLGTVTNKGIMNVSINNNPAVLVKISSFNNEAGNALLQIASGTVQIEDTIDNKLGKIIIGQPDTAANLNSLDSTVNTSIFNRSGQEISIIGAGSIGKSNRITTIENRGSFKFAGDTLISKKFTNNGLQSQLNISQGTFITEELNNNLGVVNVSGGDIAADPAASIANPTASATNIINKTGQNFTMTEQGTVGLSGKIANINNSGNMKITTYRLNANNLNNNISGEVTLTYFDPADDTVTNSGVDLNDISNQGTLVLKNPVAKGKFKLNKINNQAGGNITVNGNIQFNSDPTIQSVVNLTSVAAKDSIVNEANAVMNIAGDLDLGTTAYNVNNPANPAFIEGNIANNFINYGNVNVLQPINLENANYILRDGSVHAAVFDNGLLATTKLAQGSCSLNGSCTFKIIINDLNLQRDQIYDLIETSQELNLELNNIRISTDNALVNFNVVVVDPKKLSIMAKGLPTSRTIDPVVVTQGVAPEFVDLGELTFNNLNSVLGENHNRLINLVQNNQKYKLKTTGYAAGNKQIQDRIWAKALGSYNLQQAMPDYDGFRVNSYGVIVGADTAIKPEMYLGISASGIYSNLRNKEDSFKKNYSYHKANTKSYQANIYANYKLNNYYIDGAFNIGFNRYKTWRLINLPGIGLVARGKFNGILPSFRVNAGYIYELGEWQLIPNSSLHYGWLRQSGFNETNADRFNQKFSKRNYSKVVFSGGVRLSWFHYIGDTTLFNPSINTYLSYDWGSIHGTSTVQFDNGDGFNITGSSKIKPSYNLEASLNVMSKDQVSFITTYGLKIKQKFIGHTGSIAVRYQF